MSRKKKGINAERELIHLFWQNGWMPIRVAGSGCAPIPCPDVIASNGERNLAIECKSSKNSNLYVNKEDVEQLTEFCTRFGAEFWLGVRFDRTEWLFLPLQHLEEKKTKFLISIEKAKEKGLRFSELITNGFAKE
jgi:Holliday junction resolvase